MKSHSASCHQIEGNNSLTLCFRVLQRVHAVLPRFRGLWSLEAGLVCLKESGLWPGEYIVIHRQTRLNRRT